jgi:hypothetical protein
LADFIIGMREFDFRQAQGAKQDWSKPMKQTALTMIELIVVAGLALAIAPAY